MRANSYRDRERLLVRSLHSSLSLSLFSRVASRCVAFDRNESELSAESGEESTIIGPARRLVSLASISRGKTLSRKKGMGGDVCESGTKRLSATLLFLPSFLPRVGVLFRSGVEESRSVLPPSLSGEGGETDEHRGGAHWSTPGAALLNRKKNPPELSVRFSAHGVASMAIERRGGVL